uniref:Uncharacterized protein n=1 Tax=Tetranychus urticae TaxID=32264 RepID=T1KVT5_TETUR
MIKAIMHSDGIGFINIHGSPSLDNNFFKMKLRIPLEKHTCIFLEKTQWIAEIENVAASFI